jgi:hypothetical protein
VFALGTERLTELLRTFSNAGRAPDELLQVLTREPALLIGLALVALVIFVVLVPLIEESLKVTGPALLIVRRVRAALPVSRGTALLWGLAAGAGYAATENMLNGQASVGNPDFFSGLWAAAMILRGGTSFIHMAATATAAVGAYEAIVNHKRIRLPLLLLAAATAHGIWNTAALLFGGATSLFQSGNSANWTGILGTMFTLLLLGILFALSVVWLYVLLRWAKGAAVLRRREPEESR